MIHTATSPDEYLRVLPDDWRKERLLHVREMLLAQPGATEGMRYGMLGYDLNEKHLAVMNVQRRYVSLYMDSLSDLDPNGDLLEGMDYGRACLRIKKTTDMARVRALIANKAVSAGM